MKVMWLKAFIKAKAGVQILRFTSDITRKIYILGIVKNINNPEVILKVHCIVLMPGNIFKAFWNSVIILLLVYTATYMPYKTCFIDSPSKAS